MELVKSFIKYLCSLNMSQDPRKIICDIYDEFETLDIDLEERNVMKNENLTHSERIRIVNLIEFYYLKADDCINKYSDKEVYKFLIELKGRAEEINLYI